MAIRPGWFDRGLVLAACSAATRAEWPRYHNVDRDRSGGKYTPDLGRSLARLLI